MNIDKAIITLITRNTEGSARHFKAADLLEVFCVIAQARFVFANGGCGNVILFKLSV